MINHGDGTFAPLVEYAVGSHPADVAVADFDGDGSLDLAVTNAGVLYEGPRQTVSILLNHGDGTFATKVDRRTGLGPTDVVAADVNADGRPDLVVTCHEAGTLLVLQNTGNGTFDHVTGFGVGTESNSIAAADLNGDGKLDLAVSSGGTRFSVYLNRGDGTFAPRTTYATDYWTGCLMAADFDGDSAIDLALLSGATDSLSVFTNQGDGTFAAKQDYSTGVDARCDDHGP